MKKKDILELKKRFKKDKCTFTRMCGCYVDGNKNIVLNLTETFLNLDEDEFFKYLEIAKKVLSGTVNNNLLQLNFPLEEMTEYTKQYELLELKKSKLKDEAMLDKFYKSIIDSYDYTGNFLILLFHDAYDVITKTSDNLKIDESEEVYEYIMCAICPVSLSKASLSYLEDENRIGARLRDWVVEAPNLGFVYPAFIDRSTDVHSIIYYAKNPKDTHPELMEEALGCPSKQTSKEQKETFTEIIKNSIDGDEKRAEHYFMEIQDTLNTMIEEHNSMYEDVREDEEPIILTPEVIQEILVDSGISEEESMRIEKSFTKNFADTELLADTVLDKGAVIINAQKKREEKLEKKVEDLQTKLEETKKEFKLAREIVTTPEVIEEAVTEEILSDDTEQEVASDNDTVEPSTEYDIVLQVKPEKVSQIKSQVIDGQKFLVIPIAEDEQANVNGLDNIL